MWKHSAAQSVRRFGDWNEPELNVETGDCVFGVSADDLASFLQTYDQRR